MLVLLCLAQNSGVFSAFSQIISAKSAEISVNDSASFAVLSDVNVAQDAKVKQCELSEKSLRVCIDELPVMPLLALLFICPFLPPSSRLLQRLIDIPVLPNPRRIHLSLCRFQE
ncbi:hypothetical protein [Shewanella fidelis]|uniref:hypothetical protein n=1 Tax=Shewanella fidelis TaxID=173509 RepID=UPI001FE15CEC|nr:hypothetical protein [Shewanella fidelis]